MRWPWVSRATADAMRDAAVQEAELRNNLWRDHSDQQLHNLAKMREMYDALLEKYHSLRVSGANVHTQGLPVAERPSKPADEAIERVVARFHGSAQLRRQLQRFVHEERQKPDADEDRIAERVEQWTDPEGDE